MKPRLTAVLLVPALVFAACGDADDASRAATGEIATTVVAPDAALEPEVGDETAPTTPEVESEVESGDAVADEVADTVPTVPTEEIAPAGDGADVVVLRADIWADNWFSLWVNGDFVGEDSVPITTERSFNAESFTFEATLPLTIAVEAKDFKENDTGLEYIGTDRQQMGDGGLILQVVEIGSGEVVAASGGDWQALVTHVAPLDTSCERSADPVADCAFTTVEAPAGWTDVDFDASSWDSATVWSAADVSPKDGYDEISWDGSADLVWGADLETDNIVLLRAVV